MTPPVERNSRLVYVMGPSGVGKDTLIAYARARVNPATIVFAHRYITRPADAGGENHIALSEAEFVARRDAGLFALFWSSHGFWYGIGAEIDTWLTLGFVVVVSGSRAAWPQAKARYPGLRGILIDAPMAVRATRLAERGREDAAAIRARLDREASLPLDDEVHRLDNTGPVRLAGDALVSLLEAAR